MPTIRSEMTVENRSAGTAVGGIPGALSNQPPLESNIPEQATGAGSQCDATGSMHREATRNYELDNTVSYTRSQSGTIERLSVSVAVNQPMTTNADGEQVPQPASPEQLANIRRLLQGGIGFDLSRGDTIEVVSVPFAQLPDLGAGETAMLG